MNVNEIKPLTPGGKKLLKEVELQLENRLCSIAEENVSECNTEVMTVLEN